MHFCINKRKAVAMCLYYLCKKIQMELTNNESALDKATTNTDNAKLVKKGRGWRRFRNWMIFILILVFAFWYCFIREFSKGTREGFVTKLSEKGYIFRTHEGELIRNQFSAATEKDLFKFSISDEKVAEKLGKIEQRQYVRLSYKQYLFRVFFKGDTKYFITDVTPLATPQELLITPNSLPVQNQPR